MWLAWSGIVSSGLGLVISLLFARSSRMWLTAVVVNTVMLTLLVAKLVGLIP